MKLKKLTSFLLTTTLVLTTALMGCSGSTSSGSNSGSASGDSKTFTWALPSDIVSLDPAYAYDLITGPVVNQITESLLVFDNDGQLQPCLAESWECVDPTTYVYTIRQGVKFSDGTPMTTDDVLFSLERHRDPAVASYLAWMYDSVSSIEKTGDWEITVKLSTPDALWQYVPATSAGHVISKAYYEAHTADFGKPTGGTMGTGPYVYQSWDTGSQIVLTKNENYWNNPSEISIDKIVYKVIVEDTTRVQSVITGQVDFTSDPPIDMMNQLEAASNVTINSFDTFAIDFLSFNTQVEPFNDVNVRRAIACLVDKKAITDTVLKNYADTGNTLPMGPALWTVERSMWEDYSKNIKDYEYSMEKAKEYLAQSNYPNGFNCRLLTNELSSRNSMALMLQSALKELNINIDIHKVTNDELINMQFGSTLNADGIKDYDMGIFTWIADFPDPSGNLYPLYLSKNAEPGGSNTSGYSNAKVDELLLAQAASIDSKERTELMLQACDIIADEIPTVMIDYPKTICVFGDRVTPFEVSSAYIWNLYVKDIKLK